MERKERYNRRIRPPPVLSLLLLCASSRIDESLAFTFRPAAKFHKLRHEAGPAAKFITSRQESVGLLEYDDDEGEGDSEAQGWLRWMYTGSPLRTAEIAMREPAAFGGLPRSDRYSSQ